MVIISRTLYTCVINVRIDTESPHGVCKVILSDRAANDIMYRNKIRYVPRIQHSIRPGCTYTQSTFISQSHFLLHIFKIPTVETEDDIFVTRRVIPIGAEGKAEM